LEDMVLRAELVTKEKVRGELIGVYEHHRR
jgi:hypothetical protein